MTGVFRRRFRYDRRPVWVGGKVAGAVKDFAASLASVSEVDLSLGRRRSLTAAHSSWRRRRPLRSGGVARSRPRRHRSATSPRRSGVPRGFRSSARVGQRGRCSAATAGRVRGEPRVRLRYRPPRPPSPAARSSRSRPAWPPRAWARLRSGAADRSPARPPPCPLPRLRLPCGGDLPPPSPRSRRSSATSTSPGWPASPRRWPRRLTVTVAVQVRRPLAAALASLSTAQVALGRRRPLAASLASVSVLAASFVRRRQYAAALSSASTLQAVMRRLVGYATATTAASTAAASLAVRRRFAAALAALSQVTANIDIAGLASFSAALASASALVAAVRVRKALRRRLGLDLHGRRDADPAPGPVRRRRSPASRRPPRS